MSTLLEKAVKDLNEKDAEGAVKKIQGLMKLVMANDVEITKLQKSNSDLKKQINKLAGAGALTAEAFAEAE